MNPPNLPNPQCESWTRWQDGEPPDSFWIRPDCPTPSPSGEACGHFLAHPGAHSWQTDGLRPG